jgi:hypothetical protein
MMVERIVPCMLSVIVPVSVQDSQQMGLKPVSWGLSIPAGVTLGVACPVVSDTPIYDGLYDMHIRPALIEEKNCLLSGQ